MLDFPIAPPIEVKDTPRNRRLASINDARAFVGEAMKAGRPPAWRDALARLDGAKTEEDAIEAIGALRELLGLEGLLASSPSSAD